MMRVTPLHELGLSGRGQTVAVLDSGFSRPGFALKGWYDAVDQAAEPQDLNGHGTAMAGGLHQVAPDAGIVAVRVSRGENGRTDADDLIRGLRWVLDHAGELGITVISLSVGSAGDRIDCLRALMVEATEKGLSVVSSAGNGGPRSGTINFQPADDPHVLTVGGVREPGVLSDFSSRGPTPDGRAKPDLVAPAEDIASWRVPGSANDRRLVALEKMLESAWRLPEREFDEKILTPELMAALRLPPDTRTRPLWEKRQLLAGSFDSRIISDELATLRGTSISAPLAAGVIALLRESCPGVDEARLRRGLVSTARSTSPDPNAAGAGLLDALAAYRHLARPDST